MTDFVQLLVDSLSQCLTGSDGEKKGATDNDGQDSSTVNNNADASLNNRGQTDTDHGTEGDSSIPSKFPAGAIDELFDDSVEPQRQARKCCSQLPVQSISEDLREAGDALAQARRQASAPSRRKKSSRTTLTQSGPPPSDTSTKRRSSIKKARSKSNKRKHDIFRPLVEEKEDTRNFASRFIDNNFRSGNAILCFASPILDEDEAHCLSLRRSSPSMLADDDTVTSTLYFDAKYEHVVQNQAPIPIYSEFSVPLNDTKDSIWKIYVSGSHKTIKSIHCHQNKSLPLGTERQSIVDLSSSASTSEHSDMSAAESGIQHTDSQTCESKQSSKQSKNTTTSSLSAAASVVLASIPSPPLCNNRNGGLATISDWGKDHDQKLRSKSTSSTTALTPVCSIRSSTSLSPKMGDTGKHEDIIFESIDAVGQMEC